MTEKKTKTTTEIQEDEEKVVEQTEATTKKEKPKTHRNAKMVRIGDKYVMVSDLNEK